jgi:hypothetical protein
MIIDANPLANWYWAVATDATKVWSSGRAIAVPLDDADYVAWLAVPFHQTTPIESMETLRAVFAEHAPSGSLETYNAFKRWQKEQGGITLSLGFKIKTDDRAQAKITGVYAAKDVNPAVTTPWHDADGVVHELTAEQMHTMNVELLTHINACFLVSQDVLVGIAGTTITTREQIDAAYAAPMSDAQKNWLKVAPKKKATKEE